MRDSSVFDLPSERAILTTVFLKPDAIDEVMVAVQPEQMSEVNGTILRAMIDVVANNPNAHPSIQLVLPRLKADGSASEPNEGWAAYLAALPEVFTPYWNLNEYCSNVRNSASRARYKLAALRIQQTANDPALTPVEIREGIEAELAAAAEGHIGHSGTKLAGAVGKVIERVRDGIEDRHVIPTGFSDLDVWLGGGFRPGQLVILAARPSIGKSAFASNVAVHVSTFGAVVFLSLEMSERELTERILAAQADVPLGAVQSRKRSPEQLQAIEYAASSLERLPLVIHDDSESGPHELIAAARRAKRKQDLKLVVVDYLQLMNSDQKTRADNREREIATITRRLKIAAKKLGVPILCLSQLSREAAKADGPPQLHHLRESGAIEQDADLVLFLHREEVGDVEPGTLIETQVRIAKNRGGPTKVVRVMWQGSRTRFLNGAKRSRDDGAAYS